MVITYAVTINMHISYYCYRYHYRDFYRDNRFIVIIAQPYTSVPYYYILLHFMIATTSHYLNTCTHAHNQLYH